MNMNRRLIVLTSFAIAACAKPAPKPAPAPPPATRPANAPPGTGATDSARAPAGGGNATAPRAYNRVITGEAKTKKGMFNTHMVGDKLYFEIPARELNKDMLMVGRYTSAAAAPPDPNGGFGN